MLRLKAYFSEIQLTLSYVLFIGIVHLLRKPNIRKYGNEHLRGSVSSAIHTCSPAVPDLYDALRLSWLVLFLCKSDGKYHHYLDVLCIRYVLRTSKATYSIWLRKWLVFLQNQGKRKPFWKQEYWRRANMISSQPGPRQMAEPPALEKKGSRSWAVVPHLGSYLNPKCYK